MKTIIFLAAMVLAYITVGAQNRKNTAVITVIDNGARDTDTLIVKYATFMYGPNNSTDYQRVKSPKVLGRYRFVISFEGPAAYFSIGRKNLAKTGNAVSTMKPVLIPIENFIEPGDDITININAAADTRPPSWKFSGKGSGKCAVIQKIKTELKNLPYRDFITPNNLFNTENAQDRYLVDLLQTIDRERETGRLSYFATALLKTDISYNLWSIACSFIKSTIITMPEVEKIKLINSFDDFLAAQEIITDTTAMLKSRYYADFQMEFSKLICQRKGLSCTPDDIYYLIKRRYNKKILERMIVQVFKRSGYLLQDYNNIVRDAFRYITTEEYLPIMRPYINRMSEAKAYDFSLPDINDKLVRLSDFKGKLVLLDFWYTGCPHCAEYFEGSMKHVAKTFQQNPNIVFVTINIDRNKTSWLNGINSGNYTQRNFINLYTEGQMSDHPVIQHYKVSSYPQPVLIGKDQKILYFSDNRLMEKDALINLIEQHLRN